MVIHIAALWWMELDYCVLSIPKQILDKAHLLPVGCMLYHGDTDMLPALCHWILTVSKDYCQIPITWTRYQCTSKSLTIPIPEDWMRA